MLSSRVWTVRVVAASLSVLCSVTAVQAGGPSPGNRQIDALVNVTARLTYTVTDHGETCGLDADSTATWVLRVDDRVFCSRNDHASQVSYPECVEGNDARCVNGGLATITEASPTPDATWLQYKFYASELVTALPDECSGTCSVTMSPACSRADVTGFFRECGEDVFFECAGTCDGGFCMNTGDTCLTSDECDLGFCTPTRSASSGLSDAARGTRVVYDVVLGLVEESGAVTGIDAEVMADEACQLVACGDGYVDEGLG